MSFKKEQKKRVVKRVGAYQVTTFFAVVLLLLILFVSAAYVLFLPTPDPQAEQKQLLADLQASRDRWNSRRPRSFRYVVVPYCDCPREDRQPFVASEQRGLRSVAFRVPVTSETGETLTEPRSPMWIDDLFALIEQSSLDGERVLVDYDTSYGYPAMLDVEAETANANIRYEIRDFEILEYESP